MLTLAHPPIVEAVLDIECDMPPGLDLATLQQPSREALKAEYPQFRKQVVQVHKVENEWTPKITLTEALDGLHFRTGDEKQLVQVRRTGFSFNRLNPYTTLDDYLPEIKRTWSIFVEIARPVLVRQLRLRYINKIVIPINTTFDLKEYFKIGPRLPDDKTMDIASFLNQCTVEERDTGNFVNIVLTSQPFENEGAPFILDITALRTEKIQVEDWTLLADRIGLLRGTKNRVFEKSLTDKCLTLFQ